MKQQIYLSTKNGIEDAVIESLADGEGVRLVLFMCGCPHHCTGCHNQQTWSIRNGTPFYIEDVSDYLYKRMSAFPYNGLTISGGDPFLQRKALFSLVQKLKGKNDLLNLWVYTGYRYEEIENEPALLYVDTLIDGKFEIHNRRIKKKFRGSANQRMIHLHNGRPIFIE
ncbi:anaerobic ribonucleoside-triphosphate reductase activating protein [Heyndrickxia ginsengihumi]|uniref:Anaerobic ribonucleoside-triphosphate reductase-activating protein n=1 Tax=Heyndrickxia ginsengihumi TaxID=363870 RepID=A0A0A6Y2U3_9BACI|nr:anaerobic ribonucleoside-triphosphate reductase activating protein [Heyndrickxia ginsengihumi]KHD86607.1 hypothetical protein NG54_01925 [Heyndrickxia ginsengihumi]MBE6183095.1 anaerobic ribonucleoside-triphosphate reductase activating protein [Bacillus sp. (in: firmicutes)]MCM3022644.1 anaerobic ribonucleoside-triphosphate reductase activating protein [Heyndrickxia ginsengihumi]NEY19020.1 anaerobic ribonucleoside-triphosphate reductase activating protein [Heyndrickxia ginsengihumi]